MVYHVLTRALGIQPLSEEKLIHKQENIVKISKEDIINVNNVIEKKIQEKMWKK